MPEPAPALQPAPDVPDDVVAAFLAQRWVVDAAAEHALRLRWCGSDWSAGVRALADVPTERERSRTVLVGDDPPVDLGERVRGAGGLAYAARPVPDWLPGVLAGALARSRVERPLHRLRDLRPVEALAAGGAHDLLRGLADHAGALLDAHAEAFFARDARAPLLPLGPDSGRCPEGLCEATREHGLLVVPWIRASRICRPRGDQPVSAVAVRVLDAYAADAAQAVLVLTWDTPFLPTVGEVRLVELLGLLGRQALGRLHERERLTAAHAAQVRSLTALVRGAGHDDDATALVARVLATRPPDAHLIELYARVSPSSRGQPAWSHWHREGAPARPAVAEGALEWSAPGTICAQPDGTVQVHTGVGVDAALGGLVAAFDSEPAAIAGRAALRDVANALELGAHLLRTAADAAALDELARGPRDDADPDVALRDLLRVVAARMDADGARALVRQRVDGAPRLGGLPAAPLDARPSQADEVIGGAPWVRHVDPAGAWHLLVPVHHGGRCVGALDVWRVTPEPFDDALDPRALQRFAPHVAASAARVARADRDAARTRAMGELLAELDQASSVRAAAVICAAQVRRVGQAAGAVLWRRANGQPSAYVEALQLADDALTAAVTEALGQLLVPHAGPSWPRAAADLVQGALADWGLALTVRAASPSAHQDGQPPTSAVILLDAADAAAGLADAAQDAAAADLFGYAAALMENATRALARATAGRVAGLDSDPDALADAVTRVAREASDSDAVVLALHDGAALRVEATAPERVSLRGAPVRLDGGALDDATASLLARSFGWPRVRALSAHVVPGERAADGLLLALSGPTGPEFGWHRQQVLAAVAGRAAVDLDRATRRRRVDDLNVISKQVAGRQGVQLGVGLAQRLTDWARLYLHADARIVVAVRAHQAQTILLAGTPGLSDPQLRQLNEASRRWPRGVSEVPAGDLTEAGLSGSGLAASIELVAVPQLTGHLVLLSAHRPDPRLGPVLAEAANEAAVLVDAERVRHGLMAETGLFRHSLLSPVQGLVDAALYVADLTEDAAPDRDTLDDQRARIQREAEKVRQWRSLQRVYTGGLLGGKPVLKRRRAPLRPLIEACLERFRLTMQRRGVELTLQWAAPGQLQLEHDADAVDIILSNLLDNAAKYAFAHRRVDVVVVSEPHDVLLRVVDVGHPLPHDIDIYASGERMPWEDPFRGIHGEGLGLFLVRHLVVAHGGRIRHACHPENPDAAGPEETRPYVVQFEVALPR